MLKPNELRYGNNIYSPEGQIITVTFQTFAAMHEAEKALRPHGFNPINLNYNIFQKISLIKKAICFLVPNSDYWIHSIQIKDGFYSLYNQPLDGDAWLIKNVSHLHELQNLIFDLTGEMRTL